MMMPEGVKAMLFEKHKIQKGIFVQELC